MTLGEVFVWEWYSEKPVLPAVAQWRNYPDRKLSGKWTIAYLSQILTKADPVLLCRPITQIVERSRFLLSKNVEWHHFRAWPVNVLECVDYNGLAPKGMCICQMSWLFVSGEKQHQFVQWLGWVCECALVFMCWWSLGITKHAFQSLLYLAVLSK